MRLSITAFAPLGLSLLLGIGATGSAQAVATLVVDRGLPVANLTTPNLNISAGVNRSNVDWSGYTAGGQSFITGDTFQMPVDQQWTIDTIRTWSPAIPLAGSDTLGSLYSSITLYADLYSNLGNDPATWAINKAGTISGNTSNNDITFTRVLYQDATAPNDDYQGQSGTWYQIWQVDFKNLNWVVTPGDWIVFGVDAAALTTLPWSNHASNAALSNSPQQDADDFFTFINMTAGFYGDWYDCDSASDPECVWGNSSDINVQVFATPAPGSLALALIGLFGLSAARRTEARSTAARCAP